MNRRIYHAVETAHAPADPRNVAARASWKPLYENSVIPCHYTDWKRDARDIGDQRKLPFLKDVIAFALPDAALDDIIMFTNGDIVLHPALPEYILYHVAIWGACSSQRVDFRGQRMPKELTQMPETYAKQGSHHIGRDLFAFTKRWLLERWDEIPDYICGSDSYDLALAALIRLEKGIRTTRKNIEQSIFPAEIPPGYILHQWHESPWNKAGYVNTSPANLHNRKLWRAWAAKHLPELQFNRDGVI